jgi:hypothetical protein
MLPDDGSKFIPTKADRGKLNDSSSRIKGDMRWWESVRFPRGNQDK